MEGWIPFTTPEMVKVAHEFGVEVASWTPDYLNLIDYLVKDCKPLPLRPSRTFAAFSLSHS